MKEVITCPNCGKSTEMNEYIKSPICPSCKPLKRTEYELWEVGAFYHRLLKKVGTESFLVDARKKAKELALAWCNDESELHKITDGKDKELWIGESDFGILIRKGKM